jgi:hypothetical protein
VINEVDETLRSLLRQEVLQGTDVEVELEAPTREWSARHTAPTVDLYLYDIREDLSRRDTGRIPRYNEEGRVIGHVVPARTFRLAYLVTAWTQRPEDEHRLLSAVLGCFLEHDFVPEAHLTNLLRDSGVALSLQAAMPPPQDRQVSDVWTALGGNLKPSLDVVISMKLEAGVMEAARPLVMEPLILRARAFGTIEAEDDPKQSRHLAAVAAPAEQASAEAPQPRPRKSTRRRSGDAK